MRQVIATGPLAPGKPAFYIDPHAPRKRFAAALRSVVNKLYGSATRHTMPLLWADTEIAIDAAFCKLSDRFEGYVFDQMEWPTTPPGMVAYGWVKDTEK